MTIRLLGPGDEATAERACRVFDTEGDLDPGAFLVRPEAVLFVAEENADVVGWVYGHELVHPDGEVTMLLYALDVEEGAQRRGFGRQLTEAFVENARERGCTEVWVLTDQTNAAALATYESAGAVLDPGETVMFAWKLADGNHSDD